MSNSYYNHGTYPSAGAFGSSADMRAELELVTTGFGLLPTLASNGYKVAMVNSAGTALTASSALQSLALTLSTINSTSIGATTPSTGAFTTLSGTSCTFTGGTINGMIIGGTTPASASFTAVTTASGLTGNVTGNVTGNLTGNVVGNVTGNLTGNVTATSGTSTFAGVTITGTLNMDSATTGTIENLASPTNTNDAATKGYVDAADALKLALTGGTMSGVIAMGTSKITGLGDPTADQDAATKVYVDNLVQGLDAKASCHAATTANITLSGAQTIDGVSVIAGSRVLVKDQTTSADNGIYVAASGSWTRATDANTWVELTKAFTFVEEGTTNGSNGFLCTIAAGGTLGTTAVTLVQFSGAGQITAGAGLSKTGNQLDVGTASSSRIVVNADSIDLATSGVTAGTYKSVTVDTYGRTTGGTNPTTVSGFGITDAYTKTEIDTSLGLKLNLTGGTMSGVIAMGANKITGLADPTANQDAVTLLYLTTLYGSTAAAAASAAAALVSEGNAGASASSSSTSAANAAASYDSFDDRYLGPKASNPTLDNDGNALLTGALYWNTAANEMRVYSGSAWIAAYIPSSIYATLTGTETLTNKTVNLTSNTLSGTLAQFNTACTDADFASLAGAETLTNKTIPPASVSDQANTSTGWFDLPAGTTAQQGTPTQGAIRYLTDGANPGFVGYNGTAWGSIGGGNTTSKGMWENAINITADYTITTNNNAVSAGPITIASGVTVTVPSGSAWTIVGV